MGRNNEERPKNVFYPRTSDDYCGRCQVAWRFHQNALPLGGMQRNSGDQSRTPMEISPERIGKLVGK